MSFSNFDEISVKQIAEGVEVKAVSGDAMTMVIFYISAGSTIPEHSHPHEQIGTILKGAMEMIIGDDRKIVRKGDLWVIPSNIVHKGNCIEGPAEVLEVFSSPRKDYA